MLNGSPHADGCTFTALNIVALKLEIYERLHVGAYRLIYHKNYQQNHYSMHPMRHIDELVAPLVLQPSAEPMR